MDSTFAQLIQRRDPGPLRYRHVRNRDAPQRSSCASPGLIWSATSTPSPPRATGGSRPGTTSTSWRGGRRNQGHPASRSCVTNCARPPWWSPIPPPGRERGGVGGRADVNNDRLPFVAHARRDRRQAAAVTASTYHPTPYATPCSRGDNHQQTRVEQFLAERHPKRSVDGRDPARHKLDPFAAP